MLRPLATALLLVACLAACAPMSIPGGAPRVEPSLLPDAVRVADGAELPLHAWLPEDGAPTAVVLALHGFNDYGRFFDAPGAWLAARGIAAYAYDQRGFGGAPHRGLWTGTDTLVRDLNDAVAAIETRHPDVPLVVLGESMGGAVAVVAATAGDGLPVDGIILAAPAVRGRASLTWVEQGALWLSAHTLPQLTLSGRGLGIKASDNIEMLRSLGRDPLVIKETRVDALWGLVNLMDAAQAAAPRLGAPTLILYGGRDELVPPKPTRQFFAGLPAAPEGRWRAAIYEDGYHMLLRDLDGETVWGDIAAWIADPTAPLPSGADARTTAPPTCRAWNLCDKVRDHAAHAPARS
jgi:acylglycerol lipase